MQIRRLGPGDETTLALLAHDAGDFDLDDRDGEAPPLSDEAALAYLSDPSVLHWVAEESGVVLGHMYCALIRQRAGREPLEVLLYEIGVRKDERRRGVGRALVDEMHRFMRANGMRGAWVLADNAEAVSFYESCDFERSDPEDAVYLTTRLS